MFITLSASVKRCHHDRWWFRVQKRVNSGFWHHKWSARTKRLHAIARGKSLWGSVWGQTLANGRIRLLPGCFVRQLCVFNYSVSIQSLFIHSFRLFLERLFKSTTTQRRSRHRTDSLSEFHTEAPQATASEGLAHGLYVAARAGFEPAALRTKGAESTNEPPRPQCLCLCFSSFLMFFYYYYT